MANSPKKAALDIRTAARRDTYRIRRDSISNAVMRNYFLTLSRVEKAFYLTVAVTAVLLTFSVVFVQSQIAAVSGHTNEMRFAIAKSQNNISNANEELQFLTSANQMSALANKDGLTINNANVLKASAGR